MRHPRSLRPVSIGLWVLVALVAATVALRMYAAATPGNSVTGSVRQIGGPFQMTDVREGSVTQADFLGRPTAMFFGFTSCPDVCPTMLGQMTIWLDDLGPLADRIQPIFVSVDPERDTAEIVAEYLTAFDPRIIGLVGTPGQVASFAENYGVFYEKVPLDGGDYTMNHTAGILLFDADGAFSGVADYHDDPANALAKLRRLAERAT